MLHGSMPSCIPSTRRASGNLNVIIQYQVLNTSIARTDGRPSTEALWISYSYCNFTSFVELRYRTPASITSNNMKQQSWSRLDFFFKNGRVLY